MRGVGKPYLDIPLTRIMGEMDCQPMDLVETGVGLNYDTLYGVVRGRRKTPELQTMVQIIKALRAIARQRRRNGRPAPPPKTLTIETVFLSGGGVL